MRTTFWAAAAAAVLLAASARAEAAVVVYTYQGKITGGTDQTGVFGHRGQDLAGLDFTAQFTRDDSVPGAVFVIAPTLSSISGSGDPPVQGALTINGVTRSMGGQFGEQSQRFSRTCASTLCVGQASWEHRVSNSSFDPSRVGASFLQMTGQDLFGSQLTSADYHTLGSTSRAAALMSGAFEITDVLLSPGGPGTLVASAWGQFFALSLNVSAQDAPVAGVPEPAGWSLMIAGLGGLGALLRRVRRLVGSAGPAGAAAA